MTPEPVRRYLSVKPFESFAIHMADRREFHIRHPDAAVIGDKGRTVMVLNKELKYETLDLLLITSLRPLADQPSTDSEE